MLSMIEQSAGLVTDSCSRVPPRPRKHRARIIAALHGQPGPRRRRHRHLVRQGRRLRRRRPPARAATEHRLPARRAPPRAGRRPTPTSWWTAVRRILRALADGARRARIEAVGDHRPGPDPARWWTTAAARSVPRSCGSTCAARRRWSALAALDGPDARRRIAGNRLHAYYLGPKLAWLRRHAPGRFERGRSRSSSRTATRCCVSPARASPIHSSAALCAPLYDCAGARLVGRGCGARWAWTWRWLPDAAAEPRRGRARHRGGRARDRARARARRWRWAARTSPPPRSPRASPSPARPA